MVLSVLVHVMYNKRANQVTWCFSASTVISGRNKRPSCLSFSKYTVTTLVRLINHRFLQQNNFNIWVTKYNLTETGRLKVSCKCCCYILSFDRIVIAHSVIDHRASVCFKALAQLAENKVCSSLAVQKFNSMEWVR